MQRINPKDAGYVFAIILMMCFLGSCVIGIVTSGMGPYNALIHIIKATENLLYTVASFIVGWITIIAVLMTRYYALSLWGWLRGYDPHITYQ